MTRRRCSDELQVSPDTAVGRSGFRRMPGFPKREYYYFIPGEVAAATPLVVSVHGISRNAAEHLIRMRAEAERFGAVLVAPLFRKQLYGRYQQLEDRTSRVRADLALIDIVADVRSLVGLAEAPFFLTGFSGGAQFAHRFALYHSDRVAACVSCSAGWYSFPDHKLCYPYGIARGTGPGGLSPHPEWMSVAHHVIVGERDNDVVENLNMSKKVVSQQGVGRLRRARRWTRAMNAVRSASALPDTNLTLINGLYHDYSAAANRFELATIIFDLFFSAGRAEGLGRAN